MRPGFTLIETLIALIIAAMVTLVLLDTLSAVSAQAARLDRAVAGTQEQIIDWLTLDRAIAGLQPDYLEGGTPFEGDEAGFRGLTDLTLTGHAGAVGIVTVTLEEDEAASRDGGPVSRLVYTENGERVAEYVLAVPARLAYLDFDGNAHPAWPPEQGFPVDPLFFRPVPRVILIVPEDGGSTAVVHAFAITRSRPPMARQRDVDRWF
ncbi:hypothetical protein X907_0561 [Glycocaulis alkaliphilus]|uniref:Uncharacterized protein n=1 Tax=Glycocaulis alkaliphilus TaxID=1434191 RepID=A0A3T0E7J3_9PROT|nr:type II secretion system protein [Glycocaulis alkaliphilus]AZU03108.1 hypothetical protein X907_0561 [Glycocaulis alkaliphilus]GGB71060.1 hypothetical protein GCM10007417_08560 [Glycocaulis alkaliphilus]